MFPGTPESKLHFALSSTSGTGHAEHPTVRSFLAAKPACASVRRVHASVVLFVAVGSLIMLPPPANSEKAFIFTQHPNPYRSIYTTEPVKCQFGACLHGCAFLPESTKGAK